MRVIATVLVLVGAWGNFLNKYPKTASRMEFMRPSAAGTSISEGQMARGVLWPTSSLSVIGAVALPCALPLRQKKSNCEIKEKSDCSHPREAWSADLP